MEDGKWSDTETGTPRGSVISPLLASICSTMFDLWVDVWRKKCARGEVIVLRYADGMRPRLPVGYGRRPFSQELEEQ